MKETDYYKILNLNRDTTEEEIKRQYRRLALKFHPDRNPIDEEAEEKIKEVNEAYAVLGDPEKRRVYDRFGYSGFRMRYNGEDNFHYSSGRSRNMGDRFFFGRGMGCRKGA
jgi:DnaJ-class molecular chaperone